MEAAPSQQKNQARNQQLAQAARQQLQRQQLQRQQQQRQQQAQAAARARGVNNGRPNNGFNGNNRSFQTARVNPNFRPNMSKGMYNPMAMRYPGMMPYMPYNPYGGNPQYNVGTAMTAKSAPPVLISKDYRLQTSEKIDVRSLIATDKKATLKDVAIGQSITVTLVNESKEQKEKGGPGELTGKVVKLDTAESESTSLTLRTQSYQVGAEPGEVIRVEPVEGQYVTSILIRTQAPGAAVLFKQ